MVDEPPGHGTAEAGAGGIAYTPEPGYTGPDTVGFQVVGADGSAVGAAHLVITVVPGEAVPGPVDDSAATSEDQAVVIEVLGNDPVGSTVQSVSVPGHGVATLQADGRIRYQPATDFAGTDSFGYEGAGGGRSLGTAVVKVEVAPVADPPVARPDSVRADAGRAVVLRVLENDDDPDGDLDPSALRLLEGPARGEARVAGAGIWYRPEEGAGGSDRLLYEICDRGGLCATAEVACTVAAVNRPPAATDDSAATRRATAVMIDVLANDTDPDGDPLSVASVGEGSLGGTATCSTSGPCRYVPPVFPAGSHGIAEDTFTYTVADPAGAESRATVTVTIELGDPPAPPANRPPTARPDEVALLEDSPGVAFSPADGDSDPDGDRLAVLSVSAPSSGTVTSLGGGNYRFVPAPGFFGTLTLQYTVIDGRDGYGASTVTITVRPVNDAPSFVAGGEVLVVEDSGATLVPGWASGMVAGPANEVGQGLVFEVVSNDDPGLFAGVVVVDALSGDVGFTPAADAVGSALVGVVLVDDGGRADGGVDTSPVATLRITVSPVNDPPSFNARDRVSVVEDSGAYEAVWATGIGAGGAGEQGQALAFAIVDNSNPGLLLPPRRWMLAPACCRSLPRRMPG